MDQFKFYESAFTNSPLAQSVGVSGPNKEMDFRSQRFEPNQGQGIFEKL